VRLMVKGRLIRWLLLSGCATVAFLVCAVDASANSAKAPHPCGSPPRQETVEEEDEHPPPAYNLTGTILMGYFNERRERLPPDVTMSVANMTMGSTEGTFANAPGIQGTQQLLFRGTEKGTGLVIEAQGYAWTATFQDICSQANGRVGGEGESQPNPEHVPGYWLELIPPAPPVSPAPGVNPQPAAPSHVVVKLLTRPQKLAKALHACKRFHHKKRRHRCEAAARKSYAPKKA
jgi:hypothetical protein